MSMTIANKVIKLSDIKSNPDNPRLIKDEAYKKLVQLDQKMDGLKKHHYCDIISRR